MNICIMYFMIFVSLSLSFFVFSVGFLIENYVIFLEIEMFTLNSTMVVMTLLLDWMSLLFMSFVLLISSMVIFYSKEYMDGDKYLNRFILLVVMFVLSMMLLIISPNLISILLGWDGLGLISYCLVIYYQNVKSYNAGMLTALTNRIGDVALLLSIAWMLNFGSWNYIFYLEEFKSDDLMKLISVLIILAAMTKSAQIPFSSWLPAAMAAPTPVSSLVHSSTLVTAGVYLLIRFSPCFSKQSMFILLIFSTLTMFMSGLGANFEFDLKKIIALSTLSQLGLMMGILSLGAASLAFFHLLTHALFKALLFMCAGNVIHNMFNNQDIRYMGAMINNLPLTCVFLNVSNLSLCGLPFLSGFYSKDVIVESMSMGNLNFLIYALFYISVGLTVCYSFRLVYYTCMGESNFISLNGMFESGTVMLLGMGGLIFFVVMMGSILNWLIFLVPMIIFLPFILKLMTLAMILLGMWIGLEISMFKLNYNNFSLSNEKFTWFLAYMWNMPYISTMGLSFNFLSVGSSFYLKLDQGWVEYLGAQGLYNYLGKNSLYMQNFWINNMKLFFMLLMFWIFFLIMI